MIDNVSFRAGTKVMGALKFSAWAFASVVLLAGVSGGWVAEAKAQVAPGSDATTEKPDNELCLGCHGIEGFEAPTGETGDGPMRDLHVSQELFNQGVHAKRACVDCHRDIVEIPHETNVLRDRINCVDCHRYTDDSQNQNGENEFQRVGVVVQRIESYMKSIHAQPNKENPFNPDASLRPNAYCSDCHNAHYFSPIGTKLRREFRLTVPEVCGKCHSDQRDAYFTSVHGKNVAQKADVSGAVCVDCHTTHEIESPKADDVRVAITKNCGDCHTQQLKTYMGTYHGQVNTLGYAYTAKCFDCHGSHEIQRVDDEASIVHINNRLETCRTCHADATEGFTTFQPHGNTDDFERYPYMWLASKSMIALLSGVFAFFWTHSALWFYREYKDREEAKNRPHVRIDELPQGEGKYVKRWPALWRLAHLVFAIAIMTLVLTGTAVLYADSGWAQLVMKILGGPQNAALVHRIAAATFIVIFVGHIVYVLIFLIRNWSTFKFFGPTSTVPNLQDLWDVVAMFKWFFGIGPRPAFDHWSYWKKFDYWAPFWGMVIIGASGAMLWFPAVTASILPGWVFNVATLVHGEEAFLAAVFLFSVHFFNVHFRPNKFPMDILMFTGAMPLEEYKREHTLEYRRLVESGEFEKYLVDAPSRPMTRASKVLGATLILIGLTLLILVLIGFWGHTVSA